MDLSLEASPLTFSGPSVIWSPSARLVSLPGKSTPSIRREPRSGVPLTKLPLSLFYQYCSRLLSPTVFFNPLTVVSPSSVTLPTDHHLPTSCWTLPFVIHLYRLGLLHTPDCLHERATETSEHIVLSSVQRSQEPILSPGRYTLQEKLWGSQEQLEKTVHFIFPQTSRSEVFSHWNAEEVVPQNYHHAPVPHSTKERRKEERKRAGRKIERK